MVKSWASSSTRVAASALVSLALSGCDLLPTSCTLEFRYGLVVVVRDSATSEPAGDGATVTAQDGTYMETLKAFVLDSARFLGAGERGGVYTIRVTRPGNATWSRTGVRVEEDRCHVESVEVEARLQPSE